MKKIELLAPAGNMEAFKAAVRAGADAIYIGGKMFGARNYAGNFTMDEIEQSTGYAHLFGIKVYVTVNTLIYDAEMDAFLRYVDELVQRKIDALILQDIGATDLLHQLYPQLELHASTQMHIHNIEGVRFAEKLGIKRVVLARELSLATIREIRQKTPLQVEVFGHGALCVSYSGQCFMSYFIGGRSGNRGTCAQCCRQKYKVMHNGKTYNTNEYPLSMKDLNVLEHVNDFIEAGIDSIKIEGRMKRPEYVYLVTSLYRKAIDAYYQNEKFAMTSKERKDLLTMFNRDFTKGFLMGEDSASIVHDYRPNHMGYPVGHILKVQGFSTFITLTDSVQVGDGLRVLSKEDVGLTLSSFYQDSHLVKEASKGIIEVHKRLNVSKGDVVVKTSDEKSLLAIRKILAEERKVPLTMAVNVEKGKPLHLEVSDGTISVTVEGHMEASLAQSSPLTEEVLYEKLSMVGNTPFQIASIDIHVENNVFLPVKEIKEVRRSGIEAFVKAKTKGYPQEKGKYQRKVPTFPQVQKYSVHLSTEEQYEKWKDKKVDQIYVDFPFHKEDPCVWRRLSRVVSHYEEVPSKALVSEVGALDSFREIATDFGIHVTNAYTLAYLQSLGVQKVTLSYECNLHQMKRMIEIYEKRYHAHPNVEAILSGRPEVMIMRYDILKKYGLSQADLVDRFGNAYPIRRGEYTTLYHYQDIEKNPQDLFSIGINWVRYEEKNW